VERNVSKGTILDVFFPVWLKLNWAKIKPGYRGWLSTFAEDAERNEFRNRDVHFQVGQMNSADNCQEITVELGTSNFLWCTTQGGVLVDLKMLAPGGTQTAYHVRRVKGEKEAKAFLSGVMPKVDR
jgi:hypothetical protein